MVVSTMDETVMCEERYNIWSWLIFIDCARKGEQQMSTLIFKNHGLRDSLCNQNCM